MGKKTLGWDTVEHVILSSLRVQYAHASGQCFQLDETAPDGRGFGGQNDALSTADFTKLHVSLRIVSVSRHTGPVQKMTVLKKPVR